VQIWPSQISPNNQPGHRSSLTSRQDGARDGRRERAIPCSLQGIASKTFSNFENQRGVNRQPSSAGIVSFDGTDHDGP
jgi:hypothetical protein